ncbi:CHAP domain-containing protein [Nonomuraea sp. NPDC000554]|uniref:CHAP domain-containing protein n=1 Tax=Nonomuraea sp. NPDC000554 TaxID=3154259 RepID=UPI00332648C2
MQKFIDLLESELGYSEKAGAYTKFGHWYGSNVEFDADYSSAPWCDMYLSWAAHKLGYEDWIGQFAWTVSHAKWFKAQGAWGHTPKPGAFVFYDWSGSNDIDKIDHVGVVTKVQGNKIFTIEGNIDGGVAKRKERDTSKVVGYGYPDRIKARLDEEAAQKRLDEAAATSAKASTGDGAQDSLSSLIPHVEQGAPLAVRPKHANNAQQAPAPAVAKPTTGSTPTVAPTTGPTSGATTKATPAKKGKHAKPATADTQAITAEPLPQVTTASAPAPAASLGSPALIGSALVAALAVLAVAKTRQLRLRPAAAAASPAPKPATRARRKPRSAPAATSRTAAITSPAAEQLTPALATPTLSLTTATATPDISVTTATARPDTRRSLAGSAAPDIRRLLAGSAIPDVRQLLAAVEAIAIPEATSPFDAFARPARPSPRHEHVPQPRRDIRVEPSTGAYHGRRRRRDHPADATSRPLLRGRADALYGRAETPNAHPETPYSRSEMSIGHPDRPYSRSETLHGRPETPYNRPDRQDTPYGRSEAPHGHPEAPLRGRRHRPASGDTNHPDAFTHDTAPRGRRHRGQASASPGPAQDTTPRSRRTLTSDAPLLTSPIPAASLQPLPRREPRLTRPGGDDPIGVADLFSRRTYTTAADDRDGTLVAAGAGLDRGDTPPAPTRPRQRTPGSRRGRHRA